MTTVKGILADKIGYGKTATTIGLIDSTLHLKTPSIPKVDHGWSLNFLAVVARRGSDRRLPGNNWPRLQRVGAGITDDLH